MRKTIVAWSVLGGAVLLSGCLNLDGATFSATHCSEVGPETCESEWGDLHDICVPCDEPYDWGKSYDWSESMLDRGQTIRAPAEVERGPVSIEGGELDFYFIPAHGEDAARADTTVVYQHGNFAGIEHYIPRMLVLHELGFNLAVWDYRGYGKSSHTSPPTGAEFVADARVVREHLNSVVPDASKIVLYGYSLGAIPTVEMALHEDVCAMLLEAPFTSFAQVTTSSTGTSLGGGFLSQGHFENIDKIEAYKQPLFVFVGEHDTTFPPKDVRILYDMAGSAQKEYWEVPGAYHGIGEGTVEAAGMGVYDDRLASFLASRAPTCLK